jgi:hypothetical protein
MLYQQYGKACPCKIDLQDGETCPVGQEMCPSLRENLQLSKSVAAPLYSVMIVVWATMLMEYWKRRDMHLSLRWGNDDYKNKATYRPEWLAEYGQIYHTDDRRRSIRSRPTRWPLTSSRSRPAWSSSVAASSRAPA